MFVLKKSGKIQQLVVLIDSTTANATNTTLEKNTGQETTVNLHYRAIENTYNKGVSDVNL